ncbi:MAG: CDGSH iron-sulfur domain-containing protein [Actinomycetota bacterium]|nr:CDGSH iron-sulfur domain-containing protein [Actinomycetota bacterium]
MRRDETRVTAYKDGPFLLRGSFCVLDEAGNEIPTTRRVVALCRCGCSSIKPFCDGTHVRIGFKAPASPRYENET